MLERHYSRQQRRALNIIWNAAGRYGWDPLFMAFQQDGEVDFYFNTLLGLADKYLGEERLGALFSALNGSSRQEELDDLLWLGLEAWLYGREAPERPALEGLRRRRGERFFSELQLLSRQEMMIHSALTYTQQEIRWAAVTGRSAPVLTPREKRMAQALDLSPDLTPEEVMAALGAFLLEFFRLDITKAKEKTPARLGALGKLLRRERRRVDRLVVRMGAGSERDWRMHRLGHVRGITHISADPGEDRAYMEALFGRSLLGETECTRLENLLCTGPDQGARLYVAGPGLGLGEDPRGVLKAADREALREAAAQEARNRAYVRERGVAVGESTRTLAAAFERIFASFAQPLPESARAGALRSEAAWRLPVLGDAQVFLRPGDERDPGMAVTLLLDASASRMNTQEIIAAQSGILTRALERCRIPVEVVAFRSLRGYTVLQRLKTFRERGEGRISAYCTGGWNRDSLALRAAVELSRRETIPESGGEVRRVLLVLTDAAPDDSFPILPEGERVLPREYEGERAVSATERAVKELRQAGVFVGAIYYGSSANLESLHRIYGRHAVPIHTLEQISSAAGELLSDLLRELEERT